MAKAPKQMNVYGPFNIPFQSSDKGSVKLISKDDAIEFWKSLDLQIANKQGCYIFALRAAHGYTPWYVGQASKSFKQEAFEYHKRDHYNTVLHKNTHGTPVMFFVAPPDKNVKVAATTLNDMERFLIQMGIEKNPDLANIKHTKNLPDWGIKGSIRSQAGKPSDNAVAFRKMFGFR